MPANHTPTPAQSWIVRLARVCWERKKLSVIVVVASVSTILLAALTPLLTRQAVNDALAGNPARLPWLACGLLLIAFFDFIGNYVRRGYAGMLSLWVQHTLRGRVFDSIQKLDGAGQDALRTGQVIAMPPASAMSQAPERRLSNAWQIATSEVEQAVCTLIAGPVRFNLCATRVAM